MKFSSLILFFIIISITSCDPPNRKTSGTLFNMKDKKIQIPLKNIKSLDGKSVSIAELISTNNIKLVSFWATWCGPCNLEFNAIKSKYNQWKDKYNFEIIAISIDKEKMYNTLPLYIKQKKWPFRFYFDEQEELSKSLHIPNIPYSLLIDQKGNIVHIDQAYHEAYWEEVEAMLKKMNVNN